MRTLLLLIHLLLAAFSIDSSVPRIEISDGIITGTIYKTVFGKEVYAFFGIPYAAPPIGENRFEFPKPVKPWKGEWNATFHSNKCIQYDHQPFKVSGEEDCLYLDVYTSKLPLNSSTNELLDVIVFIHGGGFCEGSGQDAQPDYLFTDNNLVYVAFNYRLGIFGFFSSGDDIVPGNNGLKDQSIALRWVQKNIAKFGGNPSKVTITGFSAGAGSVHYHYLSPMSEGLFAQGISHSGSTLSPWALALKVPEKSKNIANLLGCPCNNSKEMVDCMKTRPAIKILENIKNFEPQLYYTFAPTLETPGEDRFLTEKPIDIIRNGKVKNLPWMVSVTKDEGLIVAADYISDEALKEYNKNWNKLAPYNFYYNNSIPYEMFDKVTALVLDNFFKNESFNSGNFQTLIKVIGDRLFTAYAEFAIKEQIKTVSAPVYYYKFNYKGQYTFPKAYNKNHKPYGVSHGDDCLQYILKTGESKTYDNPNDSEIMKLMVSIWTSFAHSGVPTIIDNVKWIPNTKESLKDGVAVLQINDLNDLKIDYVNDTSSFDFWNSTLNEY